MNNTRPDFRKHTDLLKSLARLHTKKTLGLSPAIQHAVMGKEIAFGFQREALRQLIPETAAKTVIRVAVCIQRKSRACGRDRLRRHPQHGKLASDFKLLVI